MSNMSNTNTGLHRQVHLARQRLAVYEGRDWIMKQGWDDYHDCNIGYDQREWSERQQAWYNLGWTAGWLATWKHGDNVPYARIMVHEPNGYI